MTNACRPWEGIRCLSFVRGLVAEDSPGSWGLKPHIRLHIATAAEVSGKAVQQCQPTWMSVLGSQSGHLPMWAQGRAACFYALWWPTHWLWHKKPCTCSQLAIPLMAAPPGTVQEIMGAWNDRSPGDCGQCRYKRALGLLLERQVKGLSTTTLVMVTIV